MHYHYYCKINRESRKLPLFHYSKTMLLPTFISKDEKDAKKKREKVGLRKMIETWMGLGRQGLKICMYICLLKKNTKVSSVYYIMLVNSCQVRVIILLRILIHFHKILLLFFLLKIYHNIITHTDSFS